jgi:hypothetical protein
MSIHIYSDLRLELGRQQHAEILQRAERDQLRRALRAEKAGRAAHPSELLLQPLPNPQALMREAR